MIAIKEVLDRVDGKARRASARQIRRQVTTREKRSASHGRTRPTCDGRPRGRFVPSRA